MTMNLSVYMHTLCHWIPGDATSGDLNTQQEECYYTAKQQHLYDGCEPVHLTVKAFVSKTGLYLTSLIIYHK